MVIFKIFFYKRGQPDKYLTSLPDGATIAREFDYRVVHFQNFCWIGLVLLLLPRVEVGVSASFRKMEIEQYQLVIQFLFLEGNSRSEIKERFDAVYGESTT